MFLRNREAQSILLRTLLQTKNAAVWVIIFSGVVNILGLTGSFYMLQVYDRVLASKSVPTLLAISIIALALFALMGFLDAVRSQVLLRFGVFVERGLLKPVHDLIPRLTMIGRRPSEVSQPVRDLESIRGFVSGLAPLALLDLPWMPLYLILVFVLHPVLGWISVGGMIVMTALAIASDVLIRAPTQAATSAAARRQQTVETTRRNSEVLRAMGFEHRAAQRFFSASEDLFAANQRVGDVGSVLATTSKTFRAALQSAILGAGAYLVVKGEMSGGSIIASSILTARAMGPVDLAIANWKSFVSARQARTRLEEWIAALPPEPERINLPSARQSVKVEDLAVAAPGNRIPIIRNVNFSLSAGDGVAILGPSGAGKSTLVRAMVGAWPLLAGNIRLDGAPLQQWPTPMLERMVGYLPQDVELFDGTVAENIARLDPEAEDADIVAAAQAAQVHSMILQLPQGYATHLGEGGHNLSVGQRQRVGLARALYRDPFFVVLDEPNAHLDEEGERALSLAILAIRQRGGIVAVVSHRPGILSSVNLIAGINHGELKVFGPRENFFKKENPAAVSQNTMALNQSQESGAAKQGPQSISAGGSRS